MRAFTCSVSNPECETSGHANLPLSAYMMDLRGLRFGTNPNIRTKVQILHKDQHPLEIHLLPKDQHTLEVHFLPKDQHTLEVHFLSQNQHSLEVQFLPKAQHSH